MQVITPLFNLENFPAEIRALVPCRFEGRTVGAFFLPPRRAVTDVHGLAVRALAQGRVLILYIDGLGYSLYTRARLPFIKRTFLCTPARTAYPPLTQPCMASMLTGVWPDAHGVLSRRHHKPRVPSLMSVPGAVLVEADSELLALEKAPVLTLPCEGESVDAAVLRAALPFVCGDAPLVIVHFHGLDDMEHALGDDASALADKLTELDEAVARLCAAFHGTAIFCADHGAHGSAGSAGHGAFDCRDMFVPLGEAVL